MFEKIKNWWNRDKIALAELEARIDSLGNAIIVQQEEKAIIEEELQIARREITADDEARRTSTEPWVEIKSERLDPVKGMVIELDWNDAFIQYLKENGITGRDEDTAVQKWIAMLYSELVSGLEEQSIEATHKKGVVNDFE